MRAGCQAAGRAGGSEPGAQHSYIPTVSPACNPHVTVPLVMQGAEGWIQAVRPGARAARADADPDLQALEKFAAGVRGHCSMPAGGSARQWRARGVLAHVKELEVDKVDAGDLLEAQKAALDRCGKARRPL